jgi:hypothetical protein
MSGRTITPKEAIDMFQVYRLAAVVSDLKDKGFNIVNLQKQFGVNYGVYKIVDDGENFNLFTNIKKA